MYSEPMRHIALPIALLASTLAVTAPALADPTERMTAALVRADDLPRRLGAMEAMSALSGRGEQPDLCPTTRRTEGPDAQEWASAQFSDGRGRAVESMIWVYDERPDEALRAVIDCKDETRRIAGAKLTQRSTRTSEDSARQTLIIRSGQPRRTSTSSWQIRGRFLVNVSLERRGAQMSANEIRAEHVLAARLAARSIARLGQDRDELPEPTPTQDLPVRLDTPSAAPEAPADAPWVVSLGDSYISGEGGAWSGNVENSLYDGRVFRGAQAYFDNEARTAELIANCHRSDSAAIHIGVAQSLNLACSGATTASHVDADGNWKPGIDFAQHSRGVGQAALLEEFARRNTVRMVALSIGGNDFQFADIVGGCVKAFLLSPAIWPTYCSEDAEIKAKVSDARVDETADRIASAIGRVQQAMRNAGYSSDTWRLVVHNYPSPLPRGDGIRYWQTLLRQSDGGCGLWNRDADWANATVLPRVNKAIAQAIERSGATNVLALDLSRALVGNRLCEKGTVSVDTNAANSWKPWTTAKEFEAREWVMQIRTLSPLYSSAQMTESGHPNYYGQLAIRNCLRQVYEQQRGGRCEREDRTITSHGEPNMVVR